MRPFWTFVRPGEARPRYMGYAWDDFLRRRAIAILFPFNHVVGGMRSLWWRIVDRKPGTWEKRLANITDALEDHYYSEGQRAGAKRILGRIEKVYPCLLTAMIKEDPIFQDMVSEMEKEI